MALGALGRIARRLLRGRWRNVRAIVSALWDRPYDLSSPTVVDAVPQGDGLPRVAVEATTLSGRLAGIGHYTAALCQQLAADEGATLAYFTARSWAREPPRQPGLRIPHPLQWRKRIPLGRELQFVLQGRQLTRLERLWRPDLILGPSFVLPRAKAPSVLVVHDLSHLRYPEVHPPARVAFLNRHLRPAMARGGRSDGLAFYGSGIVALLPGGGGADPCGLSRYQRAFRFGSGCGSGNGTGWDFAGR